MSEGLCLEWTAWRVWLHPRRAMGVIDDAETMQMDLEKRLNEALLIVEDQRKECARLTNDVVALNNRLMASENELAVAKRELAEAREELAEQRSVDSKLEEFNKILTGVEKMKKGYEKRISTLEARLRDARKRLGKEDNYDLFESIDMKAPSRPEKAPGAQGRVRMPERVKTPAAAGLEPESRQNGEKPSPRQRHTDDRPAPGLPEKFPKPATDDDWLLDLPPGL